MLKGLSAIVVCATILSIAGVNSAGATCAWKLTVEPAPGAYKTLAHVQVNEIYQNYYARAGSVNGKSHWISEDREFAIWFQGDNWYIGKVKNNDR